MRSHEIRRSFLDFFGDRSHQEVASSPLVPADDPTLLFTNAGMVQFKRVFQGLEKRDYGRAATSQKCVRAGGKHNDLEQVGHTARHHTFFEMLGNFSFGDYFKKEAIEYAWEWVTSSDYMGIDPERLYLSVHHTDDEARGLWQKVAGVDASRVYRLGDKDNFWQMGDTGPCGPCSEIFVDLRDEKEWRGRRAPGQDDFERLGEGGELLEIWNLVFMQFDQANDGSRSPLPAPSVDTGAGLERIAAVMQGEHSNFHTDLFMPIIEQAVDVMGQPYDRGNDGAGFRVLADHARAVTFLVADGVYPSNEGRGYVLRRILRRAVRHSYLMGRTEPTLVKLCDTVIDLMDDQFPEVREKASHIKDVTRAEEERFLETIEGGMRRFDELTSGASKIAGDDAFKLYDTFGFPIDLTQLIAGERGVTVDVDGFEKALTEQQERSREARRSSSGPIVRKKVSGSKLTRVKPRIRQKFVGYEATSTETDILAFRQDDDRVELVLHHNPFYAEAGGQVSDTGLVEGDGWKLEVEDVVREENRSLVVGRFADQFEPTAVRATVDEARRRDIERNHSATHLVHAALREVLGNHVRQAGSVVDPKRLRFDFSHQSPIPEEDLRNIETIVNEGIWKNVDVETREMSYDDAIAMGAMALFGEKIR